MPNMLCRPASCLTAAQLASLFNDAFEGYIGMVVNFNDKTAMEWCDRHFITLDRSYVFFDESISNEAIALGTMAVRDDKPGHVRIGAMGVSKAAQGKRVGSRALQMIIEKERELGTKVLELEVIKQNTPAVKLYEKSGFNVVRELLGWEMDADSAANVKYALQVGEKLEDVTVEEVDALVKKHGARDLPWQPAFVSRMPTAQRAFKLGHAWCAVSNPEDKEKDEVKMASLITEPEWRGQGEATRLVKAIMERFKEKKWLAPGLFPKELGDGIAKKVGMGTTELYQLQMRLEL